MYTSTLLSLLLAATSTLASPVSQLAPRLVPDEQLCMPAIRNIDAKLKGSVDHTWSKELDDKAYKIALDARGQTPTTMPAGTTLIAFPGRYSKQTHLFVMSCPIPRTQDVEGKNIKGGAQADSSYSQGQRKHQVQPLRSDLLWGRVRGSARIPADRLR
jgi:hypothetical protein